MNLLARLKEFIKEESLIRTGDFLLLGVSGGPDSLTMLDLFHRLQDEFSLKLEVFHLNHMFRDEAAKEAEFVSEVCQEYGIKCCIKSYNVPSYIEKHGLSPEEGARNIRRQFLLTRAAERGADKIVLGHNKDDHVETVLLNIFRGTGLRGLTGIDPVGKQENIEIIHPLLSIYRYEIEEYCRERGLNPRRDATNESLIYTRNKIRHKIIPYVENEINSGFKEVTVRMARIIEEENNFLEELAAKEANKTFLSRTEEEIILSLENLTSMEKVIRRRVLQKFIYEIKEESIDLYSVHFQALEDLLFKSETGKMIDLPGNIKVIRDYERLIIAGENYKMPDVTEDFEVIIEVPGEGDLPGERKLITKIVDRFPGWEKIARHSNVCLCDFEKIESPLIIRNRRDGDSFYPLGLGGSKKLKDFFIDEKISRSRREIIPIVMDSKERIIWIAGFRMDGRFRVKENTEKILRLELKEKGDN